MLVATPACPNLADRKPRVISEIRKVNVQRSPSLDGHPKLSGILNFYSDSLGIWIQRTVAVRDGSLLVYGEDCAPGRSYASLGRPSAQRPSACPEPKPPFAPPRAARDRTPFVSPTFFGTGDGCNSLGRVRGLVCGPGGAEFRLPLRHLNLMPSSLAPRAFCLSCRQNGNGAKPVAIFQALSQLEYERWVKTLAVEIMRQTPLEAIRFLDVLGIAALSTPATVAEAKDTPAVASKTEPKRKSARDSAPRWDRSPSSEGSTTSADFAAAARRAEETPLRSKKSSATGQTVARRKLHMSDVESMSDRDEVDRCPVKSITEMKNSSSVRRSREKVRRTRDGFTNGSSSDDARAPDEGIVMEERGSSSERSCRRALWSSDRSDVLDSPRSISSYSSYEFCDSPDTVDGSVSSMNVGKTLTNESIAPNHRIKCETLNSKKFINLITNEPFMAKNVPIQKNNKTEVPSPDPIKADDAKIERQSPMLLYRAQPFINESSPEPEILDKSTRKVDFNKTTAPKIDCFNINVIQAVKTTPLVIVDSVQSREPDLLKDTKVWSRARSCSPNSMGSRSPPRFHSGGRGARALSVGQDRLSVPCAEETMEALRQRCQNTENYVPVKEKLALFESLCRAGRLARSSEELAAVERSQCAAPRARSLHDLTRSRSPQVPVREMCKFFEKIGHTETEKKDDKKTASKKTEHVHIYEKYNSKSCNRDKYLKHKRNDCSNINKDSAFDKTVHRQGEVDATNCTDRSQYANKCNTKNAQMNRINSRAKKDDLEDIESERSKYANFTQIRQGNKIITYV